MIKYSSFYKNWPGFLVLFFFGIWTPMLENASLNLTDIHFIEMYLLYKKCLILSTTKAQYKC